MVKENLYYINTKLPDTATVSYFDIETGQNLTAEEWKQLHPRVNPSEVRIINQGEVYRSWKADIDYPTYGPMPFVDEATALIVARSDDIMKRMSRNYPKIVELFKHNRKGTVEWLKAESALVGYDVVHNFVIDFEKEGNVERSGPRAWQEYRNKIESYVTDLCQKNKNGEDFRSRLRPAIKVLSDHIHEKHQERLPNWPRVGESEKEVRIELDIGGSYEADGYYIVWSCIGWMEIKDERPRKHFYKAEFRGKPDIKILQINLDILGELNRKVDYWGVPAVEKVIDEKQGARDPRTLIWEDFK